MYRPDGEFVDGELQQRNLGESEHGELQAEIARWFGNHREEWRIRLICGQRTRVSARKIRIPNVCLVDLDQPRQAIRVTPALLCIEILSPKDRLTRTTKVMEDYLAMGVQHLWILDPQDRIAYTYTSAGLLKVQSDRLEIPRTPIYLEIAKTFALLD